MSVTFRCGECNHQYTVPDHMAGNWVRCQHCDCTLEVPQPPSAPPPPASASSPAPSQSGPKRSLPRARPLETPEASAPIPEATLIPDPEPQMAQPAQPLPQPLTPPATPTPVRPHPTPQLAQPAAPTGRPAQPAAPVPSPAAQQPFRPAPRPDPQPLGGTPHSASRARLSPGGGGRVDRKLVVIAVSSVAAVLAIVVLMLVIMFNSDPGTGRSGATATRTSGGEARDDADSRGILDFRREPAVEFGPAQTKSSGESGVVWKEVRLNGSSDVPAAGGKLWVYLPSGDHEPRSLGCVLIGPAGSRMVHGMPLASGDQAEHYPYVKEGFAVVAFEIDGPLPDEEPPDDEFLDAYLKFTRAAAGVLNARVALLYATTQMPEVDPGRIFVAGHSSAGTVALLCAEHVDGLAGCVAYAPCSDLEDFMGDFVDDVDDVLPNVRRYMKDGSPSNHVDRIRCPVMIFHAIDDRVVRLSESNRFLQLATRAGQTVQLQTVARGGHYEAMIDDGIEKAIRWMNRNRPPAATSLASTSPVSPIASPAPPPTRRELPRPTPGFQRAVEPPAASPEVQAHVRFKVVAYPSGSPEAAARAALSSLVWVDTSSIRVDRTADELIFGVSGTMVNTNKARLCLEDAGFVVGGVSYRAVPP